MEDNLETCANCNMEFNTNLMNWYYCDRLCDTCYEEVIEFTSYGDIGDDEKHRIYFKDKCDYCNSHTKLRDATNLNIDYCDKLCEECYEYIIRLLK